MKTDREWERFMRKFWRLERKPHTPTNRAEIKRLVLAYYQPSIWMDRSCQP